MSELRRRNFEDFLAGFRHGVGDDHLDIQDLQRIFQSIGEYAMASASQLMAENVLPHLEDMITIQREAAEAWRPFIESISAYQRDYLRKLYTLNGSSLVMVMAKLSRQAEVILCIALSTSAEKEDMRQALKALFEIMADGKSVLIGEPPRLVVCGETLSYRELLEIEDFNGRIDGNLTVSTALQELPSVLTALKAHTSYMDGLEIKKQTASKRYQELWLDDLYREVGKDGICESVSEGAASRDLLKRIEDEAQALKWRNDRIDSLLEVARFGLDNGDFRNAHKSLPLCRDTIFERRKDLRLLLNAIRGGG